MQNGDYYAQLYNQPEETISDKRKKEITTMVSDLFRSIEDKLSNSSDASAKRLYNLVKTKYTGKPDFKGPDTTDDGWTILRDETIEDLLKKGSFWDDPKKQESEIKSKTFWVSLAKIFEVFYAISTAYLSLYGFQKYLADSFWRYIIYPIVALFVPPVAFINYNSVDENEVKTIIKPTMEINGFKLIGATRSFYSEADGEMDITLGLKPEFDPTHPKYNPIAVEFYIHALKISIDEKQNYWESLWLTWLNSGAVTLSYYICNYAGGLANWLAVGAFFEWLAGATLPYWEYSPWICVPLAAGSAFIVAKAGIEYYILFTREGIAVTRKTLFTSNNPLVQVWHIDPITGAKTAIQWFTNGAGRGLLFYLSTDTLITTIKNLTNYLYIASDSDTLRTVFNYLRKGIMGIVGGGALKNTLDTRMRATKLQLDTFTVEGPLGKLVVPTKKLYENELKRVSLSSEEECEINVSAILQGLALGGPIGVLMYLIGGVPLITTVPVGSLITVLYSILCRMGEKNQREFVKAKERVDQRIKNHHESKFEVKINVQAEVSNEAKSLDKNGNEKLTEKNIETINWLLNFLDQLQRATGRGGDVAALADVGEALLLVMDFMLAMIFAIPQANEFGTYVVANKGIVLKALQNIREGAGTPLEDIQGVIESLKCFLSRQAAFFLPCIVRPGDKTIKQVSNFNICTWLFSGLVNWTCCLRKKPAQSQVRRQSEAEPTEIKQSTLSYLCCWGKSRRRQQIVTEALTATSHV